MNSLNESFGPRPSCVPSVLIARKQERNGAGKTRTNSSPQTRTLPANKDTVQWGLVRSRREA